MRGNTIRGTGANFLREFYRRISEDQDFRALTASEAIAAAGEMPTTSGIFPASWINANFDVWIGNSGRRRGVGIVVGCAGGLRSGPKTREKGWHEAPTDDGIEARRKESLLAAEGSDWCWWYGPEHSTANDAEFDALYRKHLTGVYLALGQVAPDELAKPIKRQPERAYQLPPSGESEGESGWAGFDLFRMAGRGACIRRSNAAGPCTGESFI